MTDPQEEKVQKIVIEELEQLGYRNHYKHQTEIVITWCGRESHTDKPDFVVFTKFRGLEEPVFIIEAKSPEESINSENHVNQARSYAFWYKGKTVPLTPYFVLFNGKEATVYNTVTGDRVAKGKSLKEVLPRYEETEKIIENFLDCILRMRWGKQNERLNR
jgi:hypothetical protein